MYSDKISQKFHYEQYFIMNEDGSSIPCNRRECFAFGDPVTSDNPYPQRWYYAIDHNTAIRLPRNELGEKWYRHNSAELKAEYRNGQASVECIGQKNGGCRFTCEKCPLQDSCTLKARENNGVGCRRKCDCCEKYQSGSISMDYSFEDEDGDSDVDFEVADERVDVHAEATHIDILDELRALLTDRELEVCAAFLTTDKQKDAAALLGITEDGIYFLKKKLRGNTALKEFLKNF